MSTTGMAAVTLAREIHVGDDDPVRRVAKAIVRTLQPSLPNAAIDSLVLEGDWDRVAYAALAEIELAPLVDQLSEATHRCRDLRLYAEMREEEVVRLRAIIFAPIDETAANTGTPSNENVLRLAAVRLPFLRDRLLALIPKLQTAAHGVSDDAANQRILALFPEPTCELCRGPLVLISDGRARCTNRADCERPITDDVRVIVALEIRERLAASA